MNKLKKIWTDPVWSKVIATAIVAVLAQVWLSRDQILRAINGQPIWTTIKQILFGSSTISNFVISILIPPSIYCLYLIIKAIVATIQIGKQIKPIETLPLRFNHTDPDVFFYERMIDAFPTVRETEIFTEPKLICDRLEIFFRPPIEFEVGEGYSDPIWIFRGDSSIQVKEFKRLGKKKMVIGRKEIVPEKMMFYTGNDYHRCYIYIEAAPEKDTGVYDINSQDIDRQISSFGYASEELGLVNGRYITRREFDDGAYLNGKKVVPFLNAELRIRYLTKHNFLITSKHSPINNNRLDHFMLEFMNDLLVGTKTLKELDAFLKKVQHGID